MPEDQVMINLFYGNLLLNLKENLSEFKAGNIRSCFNTWRLYTKDHEILQTVSGLRIELDFEDISELEATNPVQALPESIGVEVEKLIKKGVISRASHCQGEVLSPLFSRPKSDGSSRLILNLKRLNKRIPKQHFKMETISTILKLIQKDVFMVKLDIKDAYYSVPIHKDHHKFLRFKVGDQLYEYTSLPNGYSPGPRKFTKLLKPALAYLRQKMILIAAYIDDLFSADPSFARCVQNMKDIIALLTSLGFYINVDKSRFIPSQCMEFLGFVVDSVEMTIRLTEDKVQDMISLGQDILAQRSPSIRDVARFLGKMTSAMIAVNHSKLHYRNLERCKGAALLSARGNFDAPMYLNELARDDILWWLANLKGAKCSFAISNPRLCMLSDASGFGWGAVRDECRTGGTFSEEESELHINVKEVMAVFFGLRSLCNLEQDTHILLKVDNTATVQAINKKGSTKSLQMDEIARQVWKWAIDRNIILSATHIPGILNEEADEESRMGDQSSEWMIDSSTFRSLCKGLNFSPSIDLFASRLNHQLETFASFRPDPEAWHIDAFSLDWGALDFYAFPPFPCISSCIQKIIQDGARGILLTPNWPNQVWYPSLLKMAISNPIIINARMDLLTLPSNCQIAHPIWERLPLIGVLVSGRR